MLTETFEVEGFPPRTVRLFAVVDPDDRISECNDANNDAEGAEVDCAVLF